MAEPEVRSQKQFEGPSWRGTSILPCLFYISLIHYTLYTAVMSFLFPFSGTSLGLLYIRQRTARRASPCIWLCLAARARGWHWHDAQGLAGIDVGHVADEPVRVCGHAPCVSPASLAASWVLAQSAASCAMARARRG